MRKLLLDSMQKLDFVIWTITMLFFLWSSIFLWWDIYNSFLWASWIIVLMFLVWFSIELILAALKNVKWVGKITWFITNWPEALVLIVWLIGWNVLFAASTPLWSNFMNPILLLISLFITWYFYKLANFKHKLFFSISFLITAAFALLFYIIPQEYYIYWAIWAFITSLYLFTRKFVHEEEPEWVTEIKKYFLPLGLIILLISWYFLDPVVSFAAEASKAPKWLIWFLVLATLTSWPEFKSVIALLNRWKILDAFMNILVSNITNLWLAITWVIAWMIMK